MIPYIIFSLICKTLEALLWGETDLFQKTAGVGDQDWFFIEESYWFLTALFMARILYWFLCRNIQNDYYRGIVALGIMLLGFVLNHIYDGVSLDAAHFNNHLHYRNALCMMIFIWVGDFLKNHRAMLQKNQAGISLAYIIFVAGSHVIGKACAPSYTHSTTILFHQIPLYLFYATTGSICIWWISQKISKNAILEYLGKGSLVVYLVHFTFLRLFIKYLSFIIVPSGIFSSFLFYICIFVLTVSFCAVTIWVFNYKILKILIGKF